MKKILMTAMVIIMAFAFTACGGSDGGGSDEPAAFESANQKASVVLADGFEAETVSGEEMIEIYAEGGAVSDAKGITIYAVGPNEEIYFSVMADLPSFTPGVEYTMDAMKADLAQLNPGIYTNEGDVTLAGNDCVKITCVSNGEDSEKYYGIINGKPFMVQVTGLIGADGVQDMLDSIKFNY